MRGRSLSYAHELVGAERERPAADEDVAARLDLGRPVAGERKPGERERLGHRLAVLELVLDDHPDEEPCRAADRRVEHLGKQLEHRLAHLRTYARAASGERSGSRRARARAWANES